MKKVVLFLTMVLLTPAAVYSAPESDYYLGDTSVYAGSTTNVPPNIMLLFDVSASMTTAGSAIKYDSSVAYDAAKGYIPKYESLSGEDSDYTSQAIYTMNSETSGKFNATKFTIKADDAGGQIKYVQCEEAREALYDNGVWSKAGWELDKDGNCVQSNNTNKSTTYYTGDNACLQYELSTIAQSPWAAETSYHVGEVVEVTISSTLYKFVCSVAGTSGATAPAWDQSAETITDNTVTWQPAQSALSVAVNVLKTVANSLGSKVRLGAAAMGDDANKGGTIYQPLIQPDTTEKLTTFNTSMKDLHDNARTEGNHQPVNEGLWDVGTYYSGDFDFITTKNESSYDAAAQYWCQPNHIIVITSDLNESYQETDDKVGNPDNDAVSGSSMDVAHYLYNSLGDFDDEGHPLQVKTHVIQLFGELFDLETTAAYGHGLYYALDSAEQLESILMNLILSLLEADSSYVAPVVPASPESQLYSGERIYLGFFKPMNDEPWYGNIKKFALDRSNRMQGFDTASALTGATDEEGNFIIDNNGNPAIRSFWSTAADGGQVDAGGVGEQLFSLFATPPAVPGNRKLLFGDSLTSFSSANLTKEQLAVGTDTERDDLIKFIYGLDAYDEFDGDMCHWIKGDVMHSKPVIMNYSNYDFNLENEAKCDTNKTYIFVGGNDGMLHAYRDCNGTEAWGFIPDEFLSELQYLRDFDHHYYFVDGSPVIYFYDQNNDGTITASEDAVVLIVGMRRGGGKNTLGSGGGDSTYYALDITNPEDPEFLWKINNSTSGFAELGQTWSLPTLALMQIDGAPKVVAIFGGGYDTNEDLRYGATQDFPDANDTTVTSSASSGEGNLSSSSGAGPYAPSGRGCFVVEVASFNPSAAKKVILKTSPTRLWSYTVSDDESGRMQFSFPSDPLVLDRDLDGFADTTYLGDTGGQLWRFDMQSSSTSGWNATCIFAANDGFTSDPAEVGRKVFYKPTATVSGHDTFVYFGTGDREHPLNTTVTDRFYVVRDRRIPVGMTETTDISQFTTGHQLWDYGSGPLTEANLVDVTAYDYTTGKLDQLKPPYQNLAEDAVDKAVKYGWFVQLDETNHEGEKVLASPRVFNGVAYFSTYQPTAHCEGDDPCAGVLGPSRLYALDAFTGQAAFNLDLGNDSGDQEVIGRSDRSYEIGRGIASEPIVKVDREGNISVLVGRGGGFFNSANNPNVNLGKMNPLEPVYWMKW